ncbi:hypothetical protein IFT66_00125 [Rhizobium sp. CFBP 13726]|uniref:hypothetical protein n=1 Tax=Rhizobium sp. CFBP 13726 TaxID=2775296 RepID=UPI00177B3582|nr:hypothetical protein [Rhizobium sp. CFBP 13726]MBD8649478.1 hypothetical protein [Rhizobium sp. CFBP 13726]
MPGIGVGGALSGYISVPQALGEVWDAGITTAVSGNVGAEVGVTLGGLGLAKDYYVTPLDIRAGVSVSVQAEGSFSIRGALKDLAAYQAKRRVENILSKIDAQQKALAESKKMMEKRIANHR